MIELVKQLSDGFLSDFFLWSVLSTRVGEHCEEAETDGGVNAYSAEKSGGAGGARSKSSDGKEKTATLISLDLKALDREQSFILL